VRQQHPKSVLLASFSGAEDGCLLRVVPEKDTAGGQWALKNRPLLDFYDET